MKPPVKENRIKANEINRRYVKSHPFRRWASITLSIHRRRGFEIHTSLNELEQKAARTLQCEYCGVLLDWGNKHGKIVQNSPTLERVNNENIITLPTIRILCFSCNSSKRNRTHIEFVRYCKMIAEKFIADLDRDHP